MIKMTPQQNFVAFCGQQKYDLRLVTLHFPSLTLWYKQSEGRSMKTIVRSLSFSDTSSRKFLLYFDNNVKSFHEESDNPTLSKRIMMILIIVSLSLLMFSFPPSTTMSIKNEKSSGYFLWSFFYWSLIDDLCSFLLSFHAARGWNWISRRWNFRRLTTVSGFARDLSTVRWLRKRIFLIANNAFERLKKRV